MMEPPVKRLRILRSVEVDEGNPDYITAKQKQQEKFKGRLEKLFAKYGDMHESMSDEIDLDTGKVVVDRGHLRRVQRQMKRKGPGLLDSLLEPELARDGTPEEEERQSKSEEEEVQSESEDELAPTQTQKRKRHSMEDRGHVAQGSKRQNTALITSPPQAGPTATAILNALQTPNTPNPAANLFQQIQQTPLDQQAQAALFANLNHTIAHAVQQAVAPLLSMLQSTPNGQTAQALFSVSSSQAPATDSVRPAADPKWYFPPLSVVREAPRIENQRSSRPIAKTARSQTTNGDEHSSPIVTRRNSPIVQVQRRHGTMQKKQTPQVLEVSVERPQSSHSLPALCFDISSNAEADPPHHNTPSCKSKRIRSVRRYDFTEEDDICISEGRELHNMSFKAIKASKAKWSQWPLSAFYNRWQNCLKNKNLHLQNAPRTASVAQHVSATPVEHEEHFFSSIEIPETSSAEHCLPTPSSLEQEDDHVERIVIPSSSHFDDDELELLSLAGADISDVLPSHCSEYADDTYPTPDEPIPSIEGAEFRNEDELQREMLKFEASPTPEPFQPKVLPSTIPETQESAVAISSPSQKRYPNPKPQPKPIPADRAASDSSDDLDLIGTNDEPTTPRVHIKRESLTPQATRILCSSPAVKTPRPAPQSSCTMAKSTGKLNRRAYLKEVKQGWAKAKGKTGSSQKRRSLNLLPTSTRRTMVAVDVGDSEDELAV